MYVFSETCLVFSAQALPVNLLDPTCVQTKAWLINRRRVKFSRLDCQLSFFHCVSSDKPYLLITANAVAHDSWLSLLIVLTPFVRVCAANVDELARAIERANLSASDAQELVDVLLSASSGGASEWMSRGSHGRTEETLESVRKARTELAAQLEEERAAHRSLLASSKDRRAESIEEMRQMKFKLEAVQKGFAQKTKEAANALARVRSMEEELDAKSALPATAEAGRYIAEINHLKSELEGANTRLASSMADSNNVKQAAKNTEATLNNQLQQAKSNAERQQKRARDLEKQLQSEPKAGVEVCDLVLSFSLLPS